jgi:hypothetical protein
MRLSIFLMGATLGTAPAMAEDGRMASLSQATARITVSVAPRARITGLSNESLEMCVAIGRQFSLKAEEGSQPLHTTSAGESCAGSGTLVWIVSPSGSTPTLLVSPE